MEGVSASVAPILCWHFKGFCLFAGTYGERGGGALLKSFVSLI